MDKRRQKANSSEVMNIIGDVRGKNVILLDDMVDTAGSLCHAADALVEIGLSLIHILPALCARGRELYFDEGGRLRGGGR